MDFLPDFLLNPWMGKALWLWLVFFAVVFSLMALDLGVLHRDQHVIGVRESLFMTAGYVTMALAFGAWVWWEFGQDAGIQFYTGYLVEQSLSMDNVFVISMIMTYFAVPPHYQHRVLFWGIIGVILLRGLMIILGAALIAQFSWILYIFGAFLLFTGIKMLLFASHDNDVANNKLLQWLRQHLPVTNEYHGQKFFVRQPDPTTGQLKRYITPLFLALIMVETADVIFAVDSVPAVFAITQDPYIVFTSNVFAILGLRALYFALSAIVHRFTYLKYALALVLVFIGSKIFLVNIIGKIPPLVSLGVTVGLLTSGVLYSLYKTRAVAGK